MAPSSTLHGNPLSPLQALKSASQQLTDIPPVQLPHHIPTFTAALFHCRPVLSLSEAELKAKYGPEASVAVHRWKTQLTAVLQNKNPYALLTAVVLIKATIECGGWEVLQGSATWTRLLVGLIGVSETECTTFFYIDMFKRRDCPQLTSITLITLTRIFLKTRGHQSLTREITTPSLPGFITACLNAVCVNGKVGQGRRPNCHSSFLKDVLQALIRVVSDHPSIFRPFINQLRLFLSTLLAPVPRSLFAGNTVPNGMPSSEVCTLARHLLVLLHSCVPKNSVNEDWNKGLQIVLLNIHRTTDLVFRAVVEDTGSWERFHQATNHDYSKEPQDDTVDELGLPPWSGIYGGCERLMGLLSILDTYIIAPNSSTANSLAVGKIFPVFERLLAVCGPSPNSDGASVRLNLEIGKEERQMLWLSLSELHTATLKTMSYLTRRLGFLTSNVAYGCLDQLVWLIQRGVCTPQLRGAINRQASWLVSVLGPSASKEKVAQVSILVDRACADVLGEGGLTQDITNDKTAATSSMNADSYLKPTGLSNKPETTEPTTVQNEAWSLIVQVLKSIPAEKIPFPARRTVDQTIVKTRNREAMEASVLNPPMSGSGRRKNLSSLLPVLAREFPATPVLEAILRPRFPPIPPRRATDEDDESEDEMQISDGNVMIEPTQQPLNGNIKLNGQVFEALEVTARTTTTFDDPEVAPSALLPKSMSSAYLDDQSILAAPVPAQAQTTVSQPTNPHVDPSPKRNRDDPIPSAEPVSKSETPPLKRPRLQDVDASDPRPSSAFDGVANNQGNATTSAVPVQEPPEITTMLDDESDDEIPPIVFNISEDEDENDE